MGKLARWTSITPGIQVCIIHQLGVQHAIADYLSRLESGDQGIGVRDDFPNAQLFWVEADNTIEVNDDTTDSWITEMTIFLNTRLPP